MSELRSALVVVIRRTHPYLAPDVVSSAAAALAGLRCYGLQDGSVVPNGNAVGLARARQIDSSTVRAIADAQCVGDDPCRDATRVAAGLGVDLGKELDGIGGGESIFTQDELDDLAKWLST